MSPRSWRGPLALLLAATVLLGGCWDYRDIDERAFVILAGIDKQGDEYTVTAQLTVPITPPATGGGQTGGQSSGPTGYRVIATRGRSPRSAFQKMNGITYRELDVAQLAVIIIGNDLATSGLGLIDWVHRSPKVKITSFIAVSRTTAAAIAEAQTPAETLPGLYFYKGYLETYTQSSEVLTVRSWEALGKRLHSPFEDVYLPAVSTEPYGMNFDGTALFSWDNKLVGYLTPMETSLLSTALEKKMSGEITIEDPSLGPMVVRIDRGSTKYGTQLVQGKLVLTFDLTLFVELLEAPGTTIRTTAEVTRIEHELALAVQDRYQKLFTKLQELKADPFGFGERLRRKDPTNPALADPRTWREAYAQAKTDIEVRIRLKSRGRRL